MIEVSDLPAVNATLNGMSGLLLVVGYGFIRQKNKTAHAASMIGALVVSLLFLVSYLYYHSHVRVLTRFAGEGWIRPVYFTMLLSHTILAIVTAFVLAPVTVIRAARRRFDKHKAIARWTLPIWLYVSVTGVLIYLMLYHWYART
jgi:putative membrane protein